MRGHNICPSLKPSRRDGSNEGSQHMFFFEKQENLSPNYRQYPLLSGALLKVINRLASRWGVEPATPA